MESQFTQIVRDAVNELKKNGTSYCFSLEQLEEIQKRLKKNISFVLEDGIYYLKIK